MIKLILAAALLVAAQAQSTDAFWVDDYNQLRYQTGFVCDDSFTVDSADVMCKTIYGADWEVGSWQDSLHLVGCSADESSSLHFTMDDVICPEGSTDLSQCSMNSNEENCVCSEGIQIVCQSTPSGPTESCPPTEGQFGFIIDGYTYEITLEGSVTQFAHSNGQSYHLGNWNPSTNSYTNGDACPNGVQRSTTINWECGYPTTVTNVQEPTMCVYVYTAVSANCCTSEKSGDICTTTTHDNRCGPKFNQYCFHPYYPFCDEENGWCGSSDTHDIIQSSTAYDHATYIDQCQPSEVDPVDSVCAINPNRRCGQKYGHKYCTSRYWPYCHEYNGWCGHTQGHLNAQPSNRYNYATFLDNCPTAADHSNGNLNLCVAKSNQKCGPLYYNEYCYDSSMPYCNEENGWCGASEDHKNHQDATTYDYASFQANCGDS